MTQANHEDTVTKRSLIRAALLGGATLLASAAAQARGDIWWSIGINAPLDPYGASIGTTISNAPRHYHYGPPVVVAPPIYYQPAPIYYRPAPIVYAPPAYYRPAPVYYGPAPVHVHPRHYDKHPRWHKHWKRHDRDDDRRRGWRHDRDD